MTLILVALAAYLYGCFVAWWMCRHDDGNFHDVKTDVNLALLSFTVFFGWGVIPVGYVWTGLVRACKWLRDN